MVESEKLTGSQGIHAVTVTVASLTSWVPLSLRKKLGCEGSTRMKGANCVYCLPVGLKRIK